MNDAQTAAVRNAVKALTVGTEYDFAGSELRIVRIPATVAKRGFGYIAVKFLNGIRRGTAALYPAETACADLVSEAVAA